MQKRGREMLFICLITLYCEKKKAGLDLWPRESGQQLYISSPKGKVNRPTK